MAQRLRKSLMPYATLDLIFPWIVLAYGTLLSLVLNSTRLMKLAEERLRPELNTQLRAHRALAALSVIVGALWVLQNIWLKNQLFVLAN